MKNITPKPKLVFFQRKYEENKVSEFLLIHLRDHIRCLSQFFDVTIIREDCDYQQICDTYQPAITLFETGPNLYASHRLKIKNIRSCSEIPKLGLINADAWCETRAGMLSEMENWGIETFFSIAVTAAEHSPEIAENLFIWPNFVDPEIHRNYGEPKIVPVLFTGSHDSQYLWRRRIYKLVSKHYSSLYQPHPGYYHARSATQPLIHSERYARMLNAAWVVPTCGTVAKEVVRKHFEIPACKACLITEKSPGLEAAGFVDMTNCIFADENDVLDKIDYLFRVPYELERITNAGYQMVRSCHTLKQRDQIFQWFNLNKHLLQDQKIVQTNPFGALTVVKKSSGFKSPHIISNGLHLSLLRQGDEMLWAGKYEEAEKLYLKCLGYTCMLPEPKFRLALCGLYKGNAKIALTWVMAPIQYTLAGYKAMYPDPVEWAWYINALLCSGKINKAFKSANQFLWLRHPELDHTRRIISVLKSKESIEPLLSDGALKHHYSIHQMPSKSFSEWVEQICIMLTACQQYNLARKLNEHVSVQGPSDRLQRNTSAFAKDILVKGNGDVDNTWLKDLTFILWDKIASYLFDDPIIYFRLRQKWGNMQCRLASLARHCARKGIKKRKNTSGK